MKTKFAILIIYIIAGSGFLFGQSDSISSYLLNGSFTNSQAGIAFEIESTSTITITGISNVFDVSTTSANVYYRIGGVTSATQTVPAISIALGWVKATTNGSVVGTGLSGPPMPIGSFAPIQVPANTPVGIYIEGLTHYDGLGTTPLPNNSVTNSPVTLKVGQIGGVNYGFGGLNGSWFTPRYFQGTVYYVIGDCPAPVGLKVENLSCMEADLVWSTVKTAGSYVEYGPAGFSRGTGTGLWTTSPYQLTGLIPGASYDFYVLDTCGADTSNIGGPLNFSTPAGPLDANFTATLGILSSTNQVVYFDATNSQGAMSYDWDFGDSTTGTGVNTSHFYTSNGIFYPKLTIVGGCGTDVMTDTIIIEGIGSDEYWPRSSLQVFPNPATEYVVIQSQEGGNQYLHFELVNAAGQVLQRINSDKNEVQIDLTMLPAGVYILKISDDTDSISRRILKR